MAPWLRGQPLLKRIVMAHVLTDEAFALSSVHFRRLGRVDPSGYWIAAIGSDVHALERGHDARRASAASSSRTPGSSASTSSSRRRWPAWRSACRAAGGSVAAAAAGVVCAVVIGLALGQPPRHRGRRHRRSARRAGRSGPAATRLGRRHRAGPRERTAVMTTASSASPS